MGERLRRQNPLAYDNLMAKQRAEQSASIGRYLAGKPVGDVSQALMDFQSTGANQPAASRLKLDLVTPPGFRPHPTYDPFVHVQYPNSFSLPSRSPYDATSSLMPIPGSSTQVQTIDTAPSMTKTNAGQDDPPMMKTNAGQDDTILRSPGTLSSASLSPSFKANPRFENLLAREAEKMAQEKKT